MCISIYFANTYMYALTRPFLDKPPIWVKAFYRYIDDLVLIAQPYTMEATTEFFNYISNSIIRYNISFPQTDQPFLDITLNIDVNTNLITTSPYWKPTASGAYLHPASNHPEHTIKSIPFAQYLRLKRLSSSKSIFKIASTRLTYDLLRSGYDKRLLKHAKSKALLQVERVANDNHKPKNFYLIGKYDKAYDWNQTRSVLNKLHHYMRGHYQNDPAITKEFEETQSSIVFATLPNVGKRFSKQIKIEKYIHLPIRVARSSGSNLQG